MKNNLKIEIPEGQQVNWEESEKQNTIVYMDIPHEYKAGDWVEVVVPLLNTHEVGDIVVLGSRVCDNPTHWWDSEGLGLGDNSHFKPCKPPKHIPAQSYEELRVNTGYIALRNSKQAWQTDASFAIGNLYKTEQQALSAQAFAKLTHLYADWVGDYVPDWGKGLILKFCIILEGFDGVVVRPFGWSVQYLAFPTRDLADQFSECHRELIEQWMMIGKGGE